MDNIYKNLRKFIVKKIFDKSKRSNTFINMDSVQSILIMREDKIGDMIVSTILLREIKKKYPNIKIYVLCNDSNKQIIKYNPYVEKCFIVTKNFFINIKVYKEIRKYNIDLAFDFNPFEPRHFYELLKLRIINSKILIGICKKYNIYDISLDIDNIHIVESYKKLLELIEVRAVSDKYDIFLGEKEEQYAKQIKEKFGNNKIIFFNTQGSDINRTLNINKTIGLIKKLSADFNNIKFIINTSYNIKQNDNIYIPKQKDFLYIVALIKTSDIILTVDTSVVHVARAFDKKMVALYRASTVIAKTWSPYYDNAIQIIADKQCKNGHYEINNIDDILIIDNMKKLLNQKDNI